MHRIFILSPAQTGGKRAALLWSERARFELALKLQAGTSVALAEIFSFLSGLYFRGKVVYARRFAAPPPNLPGILVITPNRGLLPVDTLINLEGLRRFSRVPIEADENRYLRPLRKSAKAMAGLLPPDCQVILLGSISTPKYVQPLGEHLGECLHFPTDFVGRGDMSRGGLMLRSAASGTELAYAPVLTSIRRGKRPPKLTPKTWGYKVLGGVGLGAPQQRPL